MILAGSVPPPREPFGAGPPSRFPWPQCFWSPSLGALFGMSALGGVGGGTGRSIGGARPWHPVGWILGRRSGEVANQVCGRDSGRRRRGTISPRFPAALVGVAGVHGQTDRSGWLLEGTSALTRSWPAARPPAARNPPGRGPSPGDEGDHQALFDSRQPVDVVHLDGSRPIRIDLLRGHGFNPGLLRILRQRVVEQRSWSVEAPRENRPSFFWVMNVSPRPPSPAGLQCGQSAGACSSRTGSACWESFLVSAMYAARALALSRLEHHGT